MNCVECKENRQKAATIPYIAHESSMARAECIIKRLWITVLLLIVLLVGTNAGWLIYESQFEDIITTQVTQEADSGTNNYVVK